jgi:uncharacterized membrane protein
MSTDPYAAPKARVADAATPVDGNENLIVDGRGVASGNGWGWIQQAWALMRQHTGTWIGIFVIFAVIVVVLSMIPFLGALALYLISPILIGGLMIGCDEVRRGGSMTVGHLFAGFSNNAGKLVGVGLFALLAFIAIFLVVMVIFGVSMATMFMGAKPDVPADPASAIAAGAGFLIAMLVVFGLSVPVYMALWFSYPLVALNDFTVGQALRASFFACLKNIVPFLVYGIVMFLLAIAASIPLGLGWLLLGPVLLASFYTSYRDVFYQS